MLFQLLFAAFCCSPTAACRPAAETLPIAAPLREEKVLKCLEAWLKAYRAGKIHFADAKPILMKDSIAKLYGLVPKNVLGGWTWHRELDSLLDQAAALDSPEAANLVLEFASIGLDEGKYTHEMAPYLVREAADKCLAKFTKPEARAVFAQAAQGGIKTEKSLVAAFRAAGLRALSLLKQPETRTIVEQQLGASDKTVRLAAAEALGAFADEGSVGALTGALEKETEEQVIDAIVGATRKCFEKYDTAATSKGKASGDAAGGKSKAAAPAKVPELPASARLFVRAAIKAIGRTSWRADMTLVAFLQDFRSAETIPALIDVLQRFKDHPEEVTSGKLSGLLLHRVHETLASLSGAMFPADQPDKWRAFWEKEKDNIHVETRPANAVANNTVTHGLFGIPLQGTRVLFIIDLSGSMNFDMEMDETTTGKSRHAKAKTRIDVARAELSKVIEGLPETTAFGFITYNGNPKPKVWTKDLVVATKRNKERGEKFLDEMRADGGTNMWAGLDEGLKIKSLVYGDRYDSNVDEVFLVSDGAPSVGEITDPMEILRLVTATNRFSKVRINTIFINSPNDRNPRDLSLTPSDLMKRMAEQNGGRFVQLTSK
jgi:HEAT repeats/von Willebrand factor type A domain